MGTARLFLTKACFLTVYRCCTCHKEAARFGDEICHSSGRGRRGQGGSSFLPRPRWIYGRALQLREYPSYSHLFLLIQAQRAKIQEAGTCYMWIHGECDDGEPEHGHAELLILRVPKRGKN